MAVLISFYIFLNTIRRISEWSPEGAVVYSKLQYDGINHHIYNKDYVSPLWQGGVRYHTATVDFTDIYVNTRFQKEYRSVNLVEEGWGPFKHTRFECRKASVERLVAHEMIHAAYKFKTPQNEIQVIRKENEIISDIQLDNIDRAEVLETCD